jgi:putative tryptophan/tyrosine transport system substrate-binding protein
MIRRRELIAGLGSAAAWPLTARAQQSGRARQIGILNPGDENSSAAKVYWPLFTQRLEELGWVNGRNLRIELRWAGGNVDRMRTLARELSDLRPDVIVVSSGPATRAVQEQTRTIPVVFVYSGDPVANLDEAINRNEYDRRSIRTIQASDARAGQGGDSGLEKVYPIESSA